MLRLRSAQNLHKHGKWFWLSKFINEKLLTKWMAPATFCLPFKSKHEIPGAVLIFFKSSWQMNWFKRKSRPFARAAFDLSAKKGQVSGFANRYSIPPAVRSWSRCRIAAGWNTGLWPVFHQTEQSGIRHPSLHLPRHGVPPGRLMKWCRWWSSHSRPR